MKHWKSVKLGTLWKKSAYTLQLIWAQLKARNLHIATAVGPLRKQSSLLVRYSCCWAPWKQGTLHITVAIVGPLEGKVLNCDVVGNTWGGSKKGDRGKCLVCLPLNTPLCITLTMIVCENMKPVEHVLLHPICVLSHLMCTCKHCNMKLSLYYWTHWSCWWSYHFKKPTFKSIFHN